LNDVRNGQVGAGRVFSDSAISVNGRPGRHIVFAKDDQLIVSRIVIDNLRVYQVIYVTNASQLSQAGSDFVNSFRMTR
jgi:hypothetical protein